MFFKYFFQAKNGKQQSSEVAVMLKISSIKKLSARKSAPIALLDWYDLNQELILVLERPEPCKDLQAYCQENGGSLVEEQAKVNHLCVCVLYTCRSHCSLPPLGAVVYLWSIADHTETAG